MKELKDYSGRYDPNLKPEDFSKETLAKLMITWGRLFLLLEDFWFTAVRNRYGNEVSEALDTEVWQKMPQFEPRYICKALNIQGNGMEAFWKLWQWGPGLMGVRGSFDYAVEFKSESHSILTVNRCFAYDIWEKQGDENRMKQVCEGMDAKAIPEYARLFNPDMVVTPIRLGPRKKGEPCCVFDFKIQPKM